MTEIKIDQTIRSKRRTVAIHITDDGLVQVRAPVRASQDFIDKVVEKNTYWIMKKLHEIKLHGGPAKATEFKEGEEFLYKGNKYSLHIEPRDDIQIADRLYFPEKFLFAPALKMKFWYRNQAIQTLKERVSFYSQQNGWKYESIDFTQAKGHWGSCSAKNELNFRWELIMAPPEVLDYVVIHELAHTLQKNHSYKFWDIVEKVMPDYKKQKRWLKQYGKHLKI